jgi:DNA-binding transcriptional LysR family regulator
LQLRVCAVELLLNARRFCGLSPFDLGLLPLSCFRLDAGIRGNQIDCTVAIDVSGKFSRCHQNQRDDRYENLVAEGADMAIRFGKQRDSSFVARKLATTRRLFVASPAYLARRGTPRSLADVGRHHLIGGPTDVSEQSWTACRNGISEMQPVDLRVRTGLAAGAVACASAGLGIATVSTWMCASELASGQLVEVLADYRLDPATAIVVFPAGRCPSQKARALSDYLEQKLATEEEARP